MPFVLALIALIVWFKRYRNRDKSFINSEGELIKRKNQVDEPIDDKFFDDTVVDEPTRVLTVRNGENGTETDNETDKDDTFVNNRNSAINF